MDWSSSSTRKSFTQSEFAALQAVRTRYTMTTQPFTEREVAHLRFWRWLVHQRGLRRTPNRSMHAPEAQTAAVSQPATDVWVSRLKAAYHAGYYRTEPAVDAQTSFPWQNKTCKDCPFWSHCICLVLEEYRWSTTPTCRYFDPWNRPAGQTLIQQHQEHLFQRWWNWFSDRGAA